MNKPKDQSHSISDEIRQFYELGLEAGRLFNDAAGELEFVRTQEIISRFLPEPPGIVLDVGGGPGAYAIWLAREGFEVHLIDPVRLHLEQARQASHNQPNTPIKSITLGDGRHLDIPDAVADIVLLLGPLYHLTERSDRISTLQEAYRVLKPGGLLMAVGISRFASTLAGLSYGFIDDPQFIDIVRRDLKDGQHRNPTGKVDYFTTAFFHHPDELKEEVLEAGFAIKAILAIEGAAVFLPDLEEKWRNPEHKERILEVLRWLEKEPSTIGITGHILAIASKPRPGV